MDSGDEWIPSFLIYGTNLNLLMVKVVCLKVFLPASSLVYCALVTAITKVGMVVFGCSSYRYGQTKVAKPQSPVLLDLVYNGWLLLALFTSGVLGYAVDFSELKLKWGGWVHLVLKVQHH